MNYLGFISIGLFLLAVTSVMLYRYKVRLIKSNYEIGFISEESFLQGHLNRNILPTAVEILREKITEEFKDKIVKILIGYIIPEFSGKWFESPPLEFRLPPPRILHCNTKIPASLAAGQSYNITFSIDSFPDMKSTLYKMGLTSDSNKDKKFPLIDQDVEQIEVELQSAAGKVSGDIKQIFPLKNDKLNYYWNVAFENPGSYDIRFIGKGYSKSHNSVAAFVVEKTIKVKRKGIISPRIFQLGAYIAGTAAFILAMLQILQILGYIQTPK